MRDTAPTGMSPGGGLVECVQHQPLPRFDDLVYDRGGDPRVALAFAEQAGEHRCARTVD